MDRERFTLGGNMKKSILLLTALFTLNAFGSAKVINSEINFTAVGKPAFIKASGNMPFKTSTLEVKENKLTGTILVDMNQLNTGIDLRDEHLKSKYLHVEKFPEAKLELSPIALVDGLNTTDIMATLHFHGTSKKIKIPVELNKMGNKVKVNTDFELLLSDFNVELPSFQGITAADKVTLKVSSEIEIQ
jgi:polyisoprenoid-binding protein YceI